MKKQIKHISLLLFISGICFLYSSNIFSSQAMDDLSMIDVQQYFFGDGSEKFQKIVADDNKDWRPELYQKFSKDLFVAGNHKVFEYSKRQDEHFKDDKETLSVNSSWKIDNQGKLIVEDTSLKKEWIDSEKVDDPKCSRHDTHRSVQFTISHIEAGRWGSSYSTQLYAVYNRPKRLFIKGEFIRPAIMNQEFLSDKKVWRFKPNLPFLATSLCIALKKKSSDGQNAVKIHQYPKAYETICSLPVKNRSEFVECGWIELPATKHFTDWVKTNPMLIASIGVGGAFLVAMKIKDVLKKTND